MDRVGMGIAGSVVLIFFIDVLWKVWAGAAPMWWLHLADVLVALLLTGDAVYWLAVGDDQTALFVGLMAAYFWWAEIDALHRYRRGANEPNG